MRKIISCVAALLLLICLFVTGLATQPRVVDEAGLLTYSEASLLEEHLAEISDALWVDIVVVTVDSLGYDSAMDYADDYYDYNGYRDDGVLLLIAMEEREYWISTSGSCIGDVSVSGLEDAFLSALSDGYYYDAFEAFADECYWQLQNEGGSSGSSDKISLVSGVLICLGIGLVVGLITVFVMKSKLKTVRPQSGADRYACQNSPTLTRQSDMFLYHTTTRVARPQNNSRGGGSHFGSSGRSHGGGGGRF